MNRDWLDIDLNLECDKMKHVVLNIELA